MKKERTDRNEIKNRHYKQQEKITNRVKMDIITAIWCVLSVRVTGSEFR